jgi:hypothetical protein
MFVPSLSWQNDHLEYKKAQKKAFFGTEVRSQVLQREEHTCLASELLC